MFQKCLDLLNISETHRKFIEPFSVFGFDLFHAGKFEWLLYLNLKINIYIVYLMVNILFNSYVITGSTSSRFGVVVGIPVNFTYKTLDDVEKQNVQVVTG